MALMCLHKAMQDAMSGSSFDDPIHEQDAKHLRMYESIEITKYVLPVAMRLGDTPVLIPNTMVKT